MTKQYKKTKYTNEITKEKVELNTKKQFLIRNLVWNKHYADVAKRPETIAEELNKELQQDSRIRYSIFTIERGKRQNNASFHFQGYLEFNNKIDAICFNKSFGFTDIQARKGTQQQAIDYVKKTETKISEQVYTFGIPKKQLHKYNVNDKDIPKDADSQRILLNHRIKDNYYAKFEDIERDFELLYLKNRTWCKNLWDEYHPIKVIDAKPLKTIWIYGHSGIGKTYWTNNYLKENHYKDKDICRKSYEGIDKVWFDITDEGKKVLWLEEVREDFPNHNKLIKIIDRKDWLPVKGSQIKNTFETLIINSLHSPQKVYRELKIGNQIEVLRRLYKGEDSKVYHLLPNEKTYNELHDETNELPIILQRHLISEEWQDKKLNDEDFKRKFCKKCQTLHDVFEKCCEWRLKEEQEKS